MGAVALLLLAAAAGPLAAIISTAPDAPKAAVTDDGLQAQASTSTLPLDIEAIKADPASAGKALAEAAAADAATVGALLVSAANSDPRATADALNAAAREDAAAIGEALASGPAKDPDALAALGELLPVTPWLPEDAPREGPSRYSTGVWEKAGSQGVIDLVLVKLTQPGRRSNVSVTALPVGILSKFQERTAGATERKLEDTTPTSAGTLRSKLPAPPAGHVVAALVRLTPSGFPTLGLIAGHVTFSVEKGWLDENGIHPWSINFSVYAWSSVPGSSPRRNASARTPNASTTAPSSRPSRRGPSWAVRLPRSRRSVSTTSPSRRRRSGKESRSQSKPG